MDVILNQIDEALKKKGYSDAKASRLAVGHPSLIKNFRMKRDGDKRYNWASLERLAEVLDLELYFGPPREVGAVYTTQIDHEDFAAIPRVDARLAAGAGALNGDVSLQGALAFRQNWLRERGISPAQACLLTVAGDSMAPTLNDGDLVMIDERRTTIRNRHVYAFVDTDGSARVKRLDLVDNEMMVLTSDNPIHPTETRRGPDMNRMRVLGEIVWSAHAW
ncbi:MAG: hypothetical protein VR71_10735 [Roseovarius sp. BRH_c41]|uniref:S24 family peptidase n=1 Tax=Roseovarius sp. BRH_c41 TaxID=1629709 RepID=UPI0005F1020A|nr:LexA family transcriptional regulator [Roseovarius sp. BRH_c41]KJS43383.1 MAG: hypothetical protein VR71_10735 [Roseovarius sp. BRH_c41]